VVGGAVYVFTRRGNREVLSAHDVANAAIRWQSGYDAPYTPSAPTAAHGSGPKATPLFLDGRIITLGVSGIVAAFDRRGRLLWRTREPTEHPVYSAAASPAGEGRLAILHPGNYDPLTAFDVESGRVTWTAGGPGAFMAPQVATLDGIRQVVTVTQAAVIGVDVETGALLWQYDWKGGSSGGIMPFVHDRTIIVSAAFSGVVAIEPKRQNGGWVVEKRWETADIEMYISHPVVVGTTLYGFSRRASGQLFALDVRDGRVLWLGEPRYAENVALAKAGDLLFVLKNDGELIVAKANAARFEPMKTYSVADSPTWAQPVIAGRRLFVKDARTLTLWTID
jgi:outer membrane protein assembly factor BamB